MLFGALYSLIYTPERALQTPFRLILVANEVQFSDAETSGGWALQTPFRLILVANEDQFESGQVVANIGGPVLGLM